MEVHSKVHELADTIIRAPWSLFSYLMIGNNPTERSSMLRFVAVVAFLTIPTLAVFLVVTLPLGIVIGATNFVLAGVTLTLAAIADRITAIGKSIFNSIFGSSNERQALISTRVEEDEKIVNSQTASIAEKLGAPLVKSQAGQFTNDIENPAFSSSSHAMFENEMKHNSESSEFTMTSRPSV